MFCYHLNPTFLHILFFITLNEKYINIELVSIKSYNITYKPKISGGL